MVRRLRLFLVVICAGRLIPPHFFARDSDIKDIMDPVSTRAVAGMPFTSMSSNGAESWE